ncbi:hypothetical protein T492DRAFT_1127591, partial [Pavlovales sp. CCMP2436]
AHDELVRAPADAEARDATRLLREAVGERRALDGGAGGGDEHADAALALAVGDGEHEDAVNHGRVRDPRALCRGAAREHLPGEHPVRGLHVAVEVEAVQLERLGRGDGGEPRVAVDDAAGVEPRLNEVERGGSGVLVEALELLGAHRRLALLDVHMQDEAAQRVARRLYLAAKRLGLARHVGEVRHALAAPRAHRLVDAQQPARRVDLSPV